jgi:hypothetical protein
MVQLRDHVTTRIAQALFLMLVPILASAQKPSSEDVNKANNPLTPAITVNFQDQAQPVLYDLDGWSNAFLIRGVLPFKVAGIHQLLRYTLPVVSAPDGMGGTTTGLGDLNLFDVFPFAWKKKKMALGVGPQFTFPTATETETGAGKWQAGVVGLAVAPRKWGIAGELVTWQHSFAGDSTRPEQDDLVAQPLVIYNLPEGWYLRSTAGWSFDLEQGQYVIPIGTGAGKVWLLHGGKTVNVFVEPQWTVAHDGSGQPKFQVFAGLNLQFPIGKK